MRYLDVAESHKSNRGCRKLSIHFHDSKTRRLAYSSYTTSSLIYIPPTFFNSPVRSLTATILHMAPLYYIPTYPRTLSGTSEVFNLELSEAHLLFNNVLIKDNRSGSPAMFQALIANHQYSPGENGFSRNLRALLVAKFPLDWGQVRKEPGQPGMLNNGDKAKTDRVKAGENGWESNTEAASNTSNSNSEKAC